MKAVFLFLAGAMWLVFTTACAPASSVAPTSLPATPTVALPSAPAQPPATQVPPTSVPTATSVAPSAAPAPSSTNTESQSLKGTYTATITKEDLTKHGVGGHDVCENAGTFTLTFNPGVWGIHQVGLPDCTVAAPTGSGRWKSSGDQIEFTDNDPQGCAVNSTYKWHFDTAGLVFERLTDSCAARYYILTSHPWVKQSTATP